MILNVMMAGRMIHGNDSYECVAICTLYVRTSVADQTGVVRWGNGGLATSKSILDTSYIT